MSESEQMIQEKQINLGLTRMKLPSLGLQVSERKLLLACVDILLLCGSLATAVYLRTDLLPETTALWANIKWFVTLAVLWLFVASVFDIYNLARAASVSYSLRAVMAASGVTSLIYLTIPWLTPTLINRAQAFIFVGLSVMIVAAWRLLYARIFVQPAFQRRAIIVGAGISAQALIKTLQSDYAQQDANPYRGTGYILVGFVDDNPGYQGRTIARLPVLGKSDHLAYLVENLAVDEIIISITQSHQISPQLFEAILDCREAGVAVTTMPTIYERLTGRVTVEHASRNVETATAGPESALGRFYEVVKRLVDLWGALVGLVVLAFFVPVVWLVNKMVSPGPLFFQQQRVGEGGQLFKVIKFRSMIPDAEKGQGAVWASHHDKRITTVGRILRATHLDEIPQVLNVLRGEMSLVGPRPERPEFVQLLSQKIPFYRARHCVKPGITGWAQIHQDYGDSVAGAQEKLEYDLYYIKHASLTLDFLILLRTMAKVLGLRGR
jgi:exopolysaccharide biosynthesis polyprenyl glycosylphosphotransferase